MRKVLILFLPLLFFLSCSKEKKAKDIVVEEVITPCDCVSSFYLVISEINTLIKNQSELDSYEYLKEKEALELIMRSIDEKCIIYEGEDSDLQSCIEYQDLLEQMNIYGYE
tara:strand:- start:1363 stop:1695 length:333 start_codon:yes stop_codon:yes gene_type:complete